MFRWIAAAGLAAAVAFAPAARADEEGRVPLTVDVEGDVRVRAGAWESRCTGPCTLQVPRGYVEVATGARSQELYVEGPSRVTATRGAPELRTAGLVALLAGLAVTAAAVAIPLLVCRRGDASTDAYGRVQSSPSPCADLSDGVKAAWIAGGGLGLTAAIAGGVVYVTSAPALSLSRAAPEGATAGFVLAF